MIKNFDIKELVCPHVLKVRGEAAWSFFDPRILLFLGWLRTELGKPVYVNWLEKGFTQRGLRCNLCQLVNDNTKKNQTYNSAHVRGQAIDFNVKGMTCDEVRKWLILNKQKLPVNIRLEAKDKFERVHVDVATEQGTKEKLVMFEG